MKLLVLNNMAAGMGDGSIFDFVRMLSHAEDEIVIRNVDETSQFQNMLVDAMRFDALVVSGGDGTIAHTCYELRYTGVPILVFPSGTANLIAQNILHPAEVPALANLVREGTTMQFDLGEFDFGEERRGFMMMAGCGYDAKIMASAKDMKQRLGAIAYLRAAFDNPTPPVSHISLEVDGKSYDTQGVGVVAMNFSKVQFDVNFGLQNLPCDGKLDVCVLATQTAWDLLPSAIGAALDRSGKALEQSDALQYFRGKEIRVETKPPMMVECDGETINRTSPFILRVLPKATNLIVSQDCIREFGASS